MNRFADIVLFSLCVCASPWAAAQVGAHGAAWQSATQITLPPPTRSVVLNGSVDVQQWISERGIRGARVLPQGPRQSLVQFDMDDAGWAETSAAVCDTLAVAMCETAACRTIQDNAGLVGIENPNGVKARIVRRNDEELPDQDDPDAGMCSAAVAAPPHAGAGAGGHLNLDLRGLARAGRGDGKLADGASATAKGSESGSGSAAPDASGSADADRLPSDASLPEFVPQNPTSVNLPFQLNVQQTFNGSVAMSLGELPADSSDYMLQVSEQCRTTKVPLDGISPAHIPAFVVAAISAGNTAADVANTYGLALVEEFSLASTGESIAVFAGAADLLGTLAGMAVDARVASAQREYIYTTSATAYSDAQAALNYGPERTGASRLHGATRGSGQLVAVIDTGVDAQHPELIGRVEALDFTGTGTTPDKHGTAVAAIIAAAADNTVGAFGVAPETKILALKACVPESPDSLRAKCRTSTLVKALDAALTREVPIINMSLAGPPDDLVAKYVNAAVMQNRLVVAGAGNGGPNAKAAYPAALPNVLGVTATDFNNRRYREANLGTYIDVAAPGVDIVTAEPGGERYVLSSGTSWAAAHVSGVAALIKDLVPFYGASELTYAFSVHALDLGEAGLDPEFGAGLVDACGVAAMATGQAVTCATEEETTHGAQ